MPKTQEVIAELGERKTKPQAFSFYPKDVELVEWLAEYLGCGKSEAMRSALRHFAAHVGHLETRSR